MSMQDRPLADDHLDDPVKGSPREGGPAELQDSPTAKGTGVSPATAARGEVTGPGLQGDRKDHPLPVPDPDQAAVMAERSPAEEPGAPSGTPGITPVGLTGQPARGGGFDQMASEAPTVGPGRAPGPDVTSPRKARE